MKELQLRGNSTWELDARYYYCLWTHAKDESQKYHELLFKLRALLPEDYLYKEGE